MSGPNFQPPPSEATVVNGKRQASDDDIYVTDEQPSKRAPMAAKAQPPVNGNGIMVSTS
jgi:hypothetical protein